MTEEEIKLAEDKFEESFNLASMGMFNLLENDVEQISQLAALAEAFCEYHQQCAEVLQGLTERLLEQKSEAAGREREPYEPKKLSELNLPTLHDDVSPMVESASPARSPLSSPVNPRPANNLFLGSFPHGSSSASSRSPNASPLPSPVRSPARSPRAPSCRALYDFDPENEGELGFHEGDLISLVRRVDDNWYEGSVDGRTGMFPVNYVEVVVPLP